MKKILLLEDDESLNRGISLKLSKEGYQVLSAYTMREAKSTFEKEAIDLVISDMTLPDGNGLDFFIFDKRKLVKRDFNCMNGRNNYG